MKDYKFTIIIPVAENESYDRTLQAIRHLNYTRALIEVIIIHGNQPSKQRNLAAQKAKGDILYFLDNDSIPAKNNLKIINEFFKENEQAVLIGGPSLHKEDDTAFQKAESAALGSFIGSSVSRSRYNRIGSIRESNELELILCNIAMRKKTFIGLNGFNTALYPNEENELMNRIKRGKGKIYYHPGLAVNRSPRKNIFGLIKQILTYGRGRGEQTAVHISNLTLFPFISLAFDAYIIYMFVVRCTCQILPGLLYAGIITLTVLVKTIEHKKIPYLFYLPVIYFIIHTLYGIGFAAGAIKSLFKIKTKKEKFQYKIKWIKEI